METHPAWLKKSAVPLTIICGPPCSGKSTYAGQHAERGDIIIDLDVISRGLRPGFKQWSTKFPDYKLLHRAIRVRNMMLRGLAKRTHGKAWFVIGAAHEKERAWWQKMLGGQVVLLNPGIRVCRQRAFERGTPLALQGIDQWYAKSERHWHPPQYRHAIGVDGWIESEDVDEADIILRSALSMKAPQ